MFRQVWENREAAFLQLHCNEFQELDVHGKVIGTGVREFITPRFMSCNTVSIALLAQYKGEIYMALEDRDLPAVQCFLGRSDLLTAPAWRVPNDIASITPCLQWLKPHLKKEHNVECKEIVPLGGCYYPSPGLTPEPVFPVAAEVRDAAQMEHLHWVKLAELAVRPMEIRDGHLRVLACRAAHATSTLTAL